MLNKIFQFVWFNFLASRYKVYFRFQETMLEVFGKNMLKKLEWSELFGGAKLIIFGDSNANALNEEESMRKFPKLTLNFGVDGTRADHWSDFFHRGITGKVIYEKIKEKEIVINIGGNNVLQNQMSVLEKSIEKLVEKFPNAYFVTIPAIWVDVIVSLDKNIQKEEIVSKLNLANDIIKKYVRKENIIDITPFTGFDLSTPFPKVHSDLVHFSDEFDFKVRIPLILNALYGK